MHAHLEVHRFFPRIYIYTHTHLHTLQHIHLLSSAYINTMLQDEHSLWWKMCLSLSPGMVITLGGVHKFRFNHPAEAAVLRERRRVGAAQLKIKMILLVVMGSSW